MQNLTLAWDPTRVFPSLESPEFAAALEAVVTDVLALERDLPALTAPDADPTRTLETFLTRANALLERRMLVSGYLEMFISTDSRGDLAQARQSELRNRTVGLSMVFTRFAAWLRGVDLTAALEQSETVRAHRFYLEKAQREAKHLMSDAEEELASRLTLSGGSAWGDLHSNLTSQMLVPLEGERLPMAQIRNLARDPDRAVRERAHEAELEAWKGAEVPLAAALNGIKGEVNVLNEKRGYADALEPSLEVNHMDRATLEAMVGAVEDALPMFRRYFQAKARFLGLEKLAFYDLFAPLGQSHTTFEYPEAVAFVVEQFSGFSQKMGEFAARAARDGWMDVYPREGKVGGAFCMDLQGDESRILLNHDSSLDSVMTLAHELGHAYHNLALALRTPLQSLTPMTLAETASTFCEAIVSSAALECARDPEERLYILETQLQGFAQIVVDILSRFYFERAIFEKRRERDLSPSEFSALMLEMQDKTYGDGLDPEARHPYMWAVKGHYYSAGLSFYNFPYTFGALFSLGLYAEYGRDPEGFKARYDDLLSHTGLEDAASLAARFGMDIRSKAFWASSLERIGRQIDEYERMSLER